MSKHDAILAAIFTKPVRSNIRWHDIEALFINLGAEIVAGNGAVRHVALNGIRATFHRPHQRGPDTDKGAVVSVQKFLLRAGIQKP